MNELQIKKWQLFVIEALFAWSMQFAFAAIWIYALVLIEMLRWHQRLNWGPKDCALAFTVCCAIHFYVAPMFYSTHREIKSNQ